MRLNFYPSKSFFLLALLVVATSAFNQAEAQLVSKKAVFTTGGSFGAPGNLVTLYDWDLDSQTLTAFDSLPGDFANTVAIDNQIAYLHVGRGFGNPAGDDKIYQYDLLNHQVIDSTPGISGAQKAVIEGNWLIVSRGFGASSNYVQIFDKNDLSSGPVYNDTQIPSTTNGIAIYDEKAYVAYTHNDSGRVAVIDLSNNPPIFQTVFSLDTLSAGLGGLFTDGNDLYGLSERKDSNFNLLYAGVSKIDPDNGTFQTVSVPASSSGVGILNGTLYGSFGNGDNSFDLATMTVNSGSAIFPASTTAGVIDVANDEFFFQTTDYFSFGAMGAYSLTGTQLGSVNSDFSGSAVALAYNYVPEAVNDTVSTPEDTPLAVSVTDNDSDENMILMNFDVAILTTPNNGTATVNGVNIDYTPNTGFVGYDTIGYSITDAWGDSDIAAVFIAVGDVTGIEGLFAASNYLSVFPNPARENITIALKGNQQNGQLQVMDATGRIVYTSQLMTGANDQLDIASWPAGLYYIRWNSENQIISTRFLKQ